MQLAASHGVAEQARSQGPECMTIALALLCDVGKFGHGEKSFSSHQELSRVLGSVSLSRVTVVGVYREGG